jgi:hypothetical protein
MRIAALTYVYNENVNLPIWLKHYGKNFGEKNLYVIDRESNDGSTNSLGEVNKISIPRIAFDDFRKAAALSSMHTSLLQSFDCVVVTDCDEIIVPDPVKYGSLRDYIDEKKPIVATCIGLNVRHILTSEPPLNLSRPILSQRKVASFSLPTTKPLISSVPTIWEPGGHACNMPPSFDPDLFVFHLKSMDYSLSMERQKINRETEWSASAIAASHGGHHRHDFQRFVSEHFLSPIDALRKNEICTFEFEAEIKALDEGVVCRNGVYHVGQVNSKYVEIPERFSLSV